MKYTTVSHPQAELTKTRTHQKKKMCPSFPISLFLLLLSIPIFFAHFSTQTLAAPHLTHRYHRAARATRAASPQEYLDPTVPASLLPEQPPSCSLPLLSHDFGDTYGRPPASATYAAPPECPAPWARVVLDLSVACAGEQYDRIAAVWIDGAEVLRTSTAEPSEAGVFWRVRKDVTRYASILQREDGAEVSMMLENIVNDVFTGVYHVNVSLDFYVEEKEAPEFRSRLMLPTSNGVVGLHNTRKLKELMPQLGQKLDFLSPNADLSIENGTKVMPLNEGPADLIIPISNNSSQDGFWFRIKDEADIHFKNIQVPVNAYRAVLEIYVSYHSNDEFWYSNPPNSYIEQNNLTTGRGNGAFREVYATIDGFFVGSIVPFPVIFTGGINPLFWEPVVALGAFDLPSYNLELTPFLGLLLDGMSHEVGIGVVDGISFWLVDANLHLWLDPDSPSVAAELVHYQAPKLSICSSSVASLLNGTFTIEASRKSHFTGWVSSSVGNLTTDLKQKLKFKSMVGFTNNGNKKEVRMKAKLKRHVTVREGPNAVLAETSYESKHPLLFVTLTEPGENNTYTMKTNLSHSLSEETSVKFEKVKSFSSITDQQDAEGWMLVQDHSVLAGSADTAQTYQYKDNNGSYSRKLIAKDGSILSDNRQLN